MLTVHPFKERMKKKIPAVVHVDGSGRPELLAQEDNPLYYSLLETYFKKTGIPTFINTSFNVRGEPIVCTPEEAINCFLQTDIDYLVIDQYIVSK
jgi:carbamoyltransferase